MCLAIYKPAGAHVTEESLRNGFANHSDGGGLAWSEDGKLHVSKGFFDVEKMIEQYNKIKDFHCLIHFRKATHGKVDATNCHPFLFNDGKLALIHNGILGIKCNMENLSDTAHFVKLVLEPLIKTYNIPINDTRLKYLIETSIGTDKMAVMTENGDTYIFNPEKGEWADGVWYSNTSYKWAYSRNTTTTYPVSSPVYGASVPIGQIKSYNAHKNWRKKFEDDSEGDASYLEFWNQALAESKADAEAATEGGNANTKTQKMKTLDSDNIIIGNTIVSAEEVDNMTDEEIEALSGGVTTKKQAELGPGCMMEYGWWDEEIEGDIETCIGSFGINREQAILRVFNTH